MYRGELCRQASPPTLRIWARWNVGLLLVWGSSHAREVPARRSDVLSRARECRGAAGPEEGRRQETRDEGVQHQVTDRRAREGVGARGRGGGHQTAISVDSAT